MNKDILKGKKYSEFQYFISQAYHFLAPCSSFLYHFTLKKDYNCRVYIENMIRNKLITCLDIFGSQVLNKILISHTVIFLHVCDTSLDKNNYSSLFFAYGCFACVYVHHAHAVSQRSEECIGCPETRLFIDGISHLDAEN